MTIYRVYDPILNKDYDFKTLECAINYVNEQNAMLCDFIKKGANLPHYVEYFTKNGPATLTITEE